MTFNMPLLNSRIKQLTLKDWQYIYLSLASLIVLKVMYNQHGWVNNDSLLYFEQARLITNGEWQTAFKLFSWILYPSLIALIHTLSGFDIQTSAQCLNLIFFVVFIAGFQQLLLIAGANLHTFHWGHCLLFSTPYIVGNVLGMLLRDEGFWAAYTWGLVFWLRTIQSHNAKNIIAFQTSMIIAMLFRIEAVAYLLALPFTLVLIKKYTWNQRLKIWFASNAFAIFSGVLIFIALKADLINVEHIGRLEEVFRRLIALFTDRIDFIQQRADIISAKVLGEDLDEYGTLSLWSTLLIITTFKTLKIAGFPTFLGLVWSKFKLSNNISSEAKIIAIFTFFISFVVSIVIIISVFVLSSRYVIASGIILLMLGAFAIAEIAESHPAWLKNTILAMALTLFCYQLWDRNALDLDREAYNYVRSINTHKAFVYYDNENARFYANQPYLSRLHGKKLFEITLKNQGVEKYGFFVITISKDPVDIEYEKLVRETMDANNYVLLNTLYGWHKKSKAMIFGRKIANSKPETDAKLK